MAELHVAALPFPSRQGTQAVLDAMLRARAHAGRNAHLLTYGEGERGRGTSYQHHVTARLPGKPSLRSGPSARKLLLDGLLVGRTASLSRRLRSKLVVAHHVEAAMAALSARTRPVVFFAHTDLGSELPTYLSRPLAPFADRAGRAVDRTLCRSVDAVAAISPALRNQLADATDAAVTYVPPPWPVPPETTGDERERARRSLGYRTGERVILYAGNLDGYQGWPILIAALCALPDARLLVATASDGAALRQEAQRAGVADRVDVVELPADEVGRARIHAAADVAAIPRRAPGGLPIKLLDALARGLPTVAARRAAAGLPLDGAAVLAADDDADALATSLRVVLAAPRATRELRAQGRAFVERHHSEERFNASLDRLGDTFMGHNSR